jgi:hypothetical protein
MVCILQESALAAQKRQISTMDGECLDCLAEEFDEKYRSDTPRYSLTFRGGGCTTAASDGEEGTAGSAVGGGCWSRWWPAGKQHQERALASYRPALCRSNLA